ncbi:MAG: hypothetical protein J6S60_09940 [Oscillospiraceae bacterium]|nr:hypothetical protein [Oscillospiraceae bacterium]
MADYATVADLVALWRPLTTAEREMAAQLIPMVSAEIRAKAKQYGKDFDELIAGDDTGDLTQVVRSVCCDVVRRYMCDVSADGPSLTQMSQGAGGYTVSGSFLVPGGGLFLKRSELDRLGLRRQRIGVIEFYGSMD